MSADVTLRGREAECAALGTLLDAARRGESRALVIRGEPGVGKSALLDFTMDLAPDFRILRAVGVESEMELAFASLQQVCAPTLGQLERIAGPVETRFESRSVSVPVRLRIGSWSGSRH